MTEPSEYEGMAPREEWERSDVHKASTYSCAKCGRKFDGPHDLYDHLDAEHPQPRRKRGEGER